MALTTNKYNTREPDMIYLCKPDSKVHIALNGVHTDDVALEIHARDWWSLRFRVDRFINIDGELVESNGYEYLHNHMELLLPQLGFFQMQEPEVINEGQDEYKTVLAYSCDRELVDKDYYGLKVNTGEVDSLEYLATDNIDEATGIAKQYVTIYNPLNPELSLLDVLFQKAPNWEVRAEDIDKILWTRKIQIDEDNVNIWGLLNSTVGPKGNCIFLYDIMNRRVKAYAKETLNSKQFDTNIFIGLRNLAKTINITVDEDSIATRFNVAGDEELNITAVNYGDRRIWNLDWYLTNNYMDDELIEKIQAWKQWLDDNRSVYGNLSRQIADVQNKIDELNLKVPNDADYWKQWDSMTEDLLRANLEMYQGLMTALQESVDEDPQFDDDGNYIPWEDGEGNVDHARYLALLKQSANGYGGYYSYIEYKDYVIPNIEIAISNLGKVADKKADYVTDYETNWELYGLEELKGKLSDFESRLTSLKNYAKPWNELTTEEKASYQNSEEQYNTVGRSEYVRLYNLIGYGANPPEGTIMHRKAELESEIADLEAEMATLRATARELAEHATVDYAGWNFTDDDKRIINKLMVDKDYENTNIITTSLDTTTTIIDREMELFEDASERLSEASQPQFRFSCTLENLYELEEFTNWYPSLELLKFVRLGVRDDYMVKLRIMGIIFNPCEKKPDLELIFSNFIVSKLGRSDMEDVLQNAGNSGSKNSITLGTNAKVDESFVNNLLQQMIRSNNFSNAVGNIAGGVGTTDSVAVKNIVTDYMSAYLIDVGKIKGEEAEFDRLFAQYIDADYITTEIINAEKGDFEELSTKILSAGTINATQITGTNADFQNLTTTVLTVGRDSITTIAEGTITTENVVASLVEAQQGDFDELTANSAFVQYLNSGVIEAQSVTADTIIAGLASVTPEQISKFDLLAGSAYIDYLESNMIVASEIKVDDLKAKMATIDVATVGSEFVRSLQALSATAAETKITDAYIYNAVAGKISVADLEAGDITISNSARILSENGALVMNGTALQIIGKDKNNNDYVGVQLGYDTTQTPSLILRNEDGAVVLNPSGITADAVADELIVNNMIKTGTISEDRLNFQVMKSGDRVDIAQIYENGSQWGAQYTTFKNNTTSDISTLNTFKNTATQAIQDLQGLVQSVELVGEQVFTETNGAVVPNYIKINTIIKNNLAIGKWYIDGVEVTNELDVDDITADSISDPVIYNDKKSLAIPSSVMANKKQILVKVEGVDTTKYDEMSVYKVVDGESGYSCIITASTPTIFKVDDGDQTSTATCTVYKGATTITPTAYRWFKYNSDGTTTQIGATRSITVNLTPSEVKKSIYCEVDV